MFVVIVGNKDVIFCAVYNRFLDSMIDTYF